MRVLAVMTTGWIIRFPIVCGGSLLIVCQCLRSRSWVWLNSRLSTATQVRGSVPNCLGSLFASSASASLVASAGLRAGPKRRPTMALMVSAMSLYMQFVRPLCIREMLLFTPTNEFQDLLADSPVVSIQLAADLLGHPRPDMVAWAWVITLMGRIPRSCPLHLGIMVNRTALPDHQILGCERGNGEGSSILDQGQATGES